MKGWTRAENVKHTKKPSSVESNNRHELFKDDDDDYDDDKDEDKSTCIVTSEEIKIQKESKNRNNRKVKNKKAMW